MKPRVDDIYIIPVFPWGKDDLMEAVVTCVLSTQVVCEDSQGHTHMVAFKHLIEKQEK